MVTDWGVAARLIVEAVEESRRVKPASWAARRVLLRRGLAGRPVDRFVTGVVTGLARSMGIVERVCREVFGECNAALLALAYVAAVDDRMGRGAREALIRELARLAGVSLGDLEVLRRVRLDPVEERLRVARWIYDELVAAWGRRLAEEVLGAMRGGRRVHWLRVNRLRVPGWEGLVGKLLRWARGRAWRSSYIPWMVAVEGPLPPRITSLLDRGILVAQDESAAVAALLLNPKPGELVLDVCAAPGGKTSMLQDLAGGRAQVVSLEVSVSRLYSTRARLAKLRVDAVLAASDATLPPLREGVADAVLLDPPCTSTGVLDKSPDARWQPREALERLAALQYRLLEATWRLLRRGGRLLYSTCSLLPRENEELIERFLSEHPEAELVELPGVYDESPLLPGTRRSWPHWHRTGGMFYAMLVKKP